MSVIPLVQPDGPPPPSTQKTWETYLHESLEDTWRPDEWDPQNVTFTGKLGSPHTGIAVCLREGCDVIVDGAARNCTGCRKAKSKLPPGDSLPPRAPHPRRSSQPRAAAEFSLSHLPPTLRNEILYGLQDRDRQQLAIRPYYVRLFLKRIRPETNSLLDLQDADYRGMTKSLLRSFQQSLGQLKMIYRGSDGTEDDIWDCALVGLVSQRDQTYRAVSGHLDFTIISQRWLRDITKEVLRSIRPSAATCQQYIQATAIASSVLTGRANGDRPTKLNTADMSAIFQEISSSRNPKTGNIYSHSHRRGLLGYWRRLNEYARASGLMDDIPGSFVLRSDHVVKPVDISEDTIGRTIPEEWIAYLDSKIHLLANTSSYAPKGWKVEDLREMYRVFYQILRDTGRRPSEVARLTSNPVEYIRSEPSLIYDNRKAGRNRRRLPIDRSTAEVIEEWRQKRSKLPVSPHSAGYLFPTPGTRNQERRGHLSTGQFRKIFNRWVDTISSPLGLSETAASFRASDLELYGFRHAYAQRHADNGTPIDVLRDLMDHREIDTTMGYYQVTLKRKQKAVSLVSRRAVDRDGTAAPFTTGSAYERASVATAYGNCTEPSNVKAGGKSCPIRFQCSGCSFYRPDPSYIGAIEQQIAQLRADRAIAVTAEASQWVIENIDAQIDSYQKIIETMQKQLNELPSEEREAISSACSDLRKARQITLIPVESVNRRSE